MMAWCTFRLTALIGVGPCRVHEADRGLVDFLNVKPDTSIVAAVELDDASHDRQNRRTGECRSPRKSYPSRLTASLHAGPPLNTSETGRKPSETVILLAERLVSC